MTRADIHRGLFGCLGLALLAGCGGYGASVLKIQRYADAGYPEKALAAANQLLGVPSESEVPPTVTGNAPLYLLERGSLLQEAGSYRLSSRDLSLADDHLEVLRLSGNALQSLGKYLYSDTSEPYKAWPHEKTLLNTLNMINFLALGDVSGAKVEARRLKVSEDLITETRGEKSLTAFGSALAGFTFEIADQPEVAMRYYGDAYERGAREVTPWAQQVFQQSGATDRRLAEILKVAPSTAGSQGELMVIIGVGRAPRRIPLRIPVGVFLADVAAWGLDGTSEDVRKARHLYEQGLVKWLVLPGLEAATAVPRAPEVSLGSHPLKTVRLMDVSNQMFREYDKRKGALVLAALSRLAARSAVGSVVQGAAKKNNDSDVARSLSLLTQGVLTLLDKPDTRGWTTLPAAFYVARGHLPESSSTVTIALPGSGGGQTVTREVVPDGKNFRVIYYWATH